LRHSGNWKPQKRFKEIEKIHQKPGRKVSGFCFGCWIGERGPQKSWIRITNAYASVIRIGVGMPGIIEGFDFANLFYKINQKLFKVIIIADKKRERFCKTVNIWRHLHEKLKKIEKEGGVMSRALEQCLTSEVNLDDVLEERGIDRETHPCCGAKIATFSLSADTITKIEKVKKKNTGISASNVINLSLTFRGVTLDSLLGKSKKKAGRVGDPIPGDILEHARQIAKNYQE
jgi:hypothetical protein